MKLILGQRCMLFVLHNQYHACWCSGDFRSQSISRYGIDRQSRPEYSVSNIKRINSANWPTTVITPTSQRTSPVYVGYRLTFWNISLGSSCGGFSVAGNKLWWNLNRNTQHFWQENAFENVTCKMTAILLTPQWSICCMCNQLLYHFMLFIIYQFSVK